MGKLTVNQKVELEKIRCTVCPAAAAAKKTGIARNIFIARMLLTMAVMDIGAAIWRALCGFSLSVKIGEYTLSLTNFNKKIGVLQLNLVPVVTCPGRTALCESLGYCVQAVEQYANVKKAYWNNWQVIVNHINQFQTGMISLLQKYAEAGGQFFRFHSYGDFFSQAYLNACFAIAKAVPSIKFAAHTKSFWFDYSEKPENFSVLFSIFPDSKTEKVLEAAEKWGFPVAVAGDPSDYEGKAKEYAQNATICTGNCGTCGMKCWSAKDEFSSGSVRFPWHGQKAVATMKTKKSRKAGN